MQNILLVEDSNDFKLMVTEVLKNQYLVTCSGTIASAREELNKKSFALIILDVSLPDGDGFEFCSELQSRTEIRNIPIVMLTGRNQPSDRVLGWNTGADDYIEKPFNPFEFRARIDARIRKHQSKSAADEIIVKGVLQLNTVFHDAKIVSEQGERSLSLTRNEFRLLQHLVRNQDRVLSRGQLQLAVWGENTHITDRTVDKHISALRQKLEMQAHYIQTVSGLGYRFTLQKAA